MSPHVVEDDRPSELEAAAVLEQLFARLRAAEARCDTFAVHPGSVLAGDDRATAYDPISYQARYLLVAAFDHIGTFQRALADHGMPTVAAYPLIRASLESAAQVLWLTTGGTRGKRVFRALHRVWDAASLSDEALRHLDPARVSSLPRLKARLDELLAASKAGQRSIDRRHPSMTNIVVEAGKHVPPRRFQPIDVWRLCSSMSHSNPTVAVAVLERRPDDAGGADTYLMTTSYRAMAVFVNVLVEMIEAALDSRDRLNLSGER